MATILIVDDVTANRARLVRVLSGQGHHLLEATDGRQALAAVEGTRPDLVITDLLMPVMGGYELVKQLRLNPATSGIPVLFYTAPYAEREARALALAEGIPWVLIKPATAEEVLTTVERVLAEGPPPHGRGEEAPQAAAYRQEQLRLLTAQVSAGVDELAAANIRLRALVNIGLELGSASDPDALLASVCTNAVDLFGATYASLGILDPDALTVRRFATFGTESENWLAPGDTVSGLLATVVAQHRIFRGDNPGGNPASLDLPATHPEVQSVLVVPIATVGYAYGWIELVGNEGRNFNEEDEDLLLALAGQLGRIYELERESRAHHQSETALGVAEEQMRFALESARVGIWDWDVHSGELKWSSLLEAQYGLEPGSFGGTVDDFLGGIHPDDLAEVVDTITRAGTTGEDFATEHRVVWPDGSVHWLRGAGRIHLGENGEPVRGLGISMDVSARHSLEDQYQQAQKMEAVGRLAGGVAHDFNNLLTVILGYCQHLLAESTPADPRRADLAEIEKAALSAATMTRQLLAFSRKEIIEPAVMDLNATVADTALMIERLIGEDIQVAQVLGTSLGPIRADCGQVEQVIMNLAINARDAMPAGGRLTIETANVTLDEDYAAAHLAVDAGEYVRLTVSDTGCGMTPEVQARLFEPFFTTKPVGKGTGLGLATVHGIVARAGGTVHVYSEVGKGTSFQVYFPSHAGATPATEQVATVLPATIGGQAVLVVEDMEALRRLIVATLQHHGYTVLAAANGEEALREFTRYGPIDVLLTDVVMPGQSGPELVGKLREQQPALKIIYMSGYTEDTIAHHGILQPGIAFLQKPFTADQVDRKLREVLSE